MEGHFMTKDGEMGPRVDALMAMLEHVNEFWEDVRAGRRKYEALVPVDPAVIEKILQGEDGSHVE